MKSKDKIFQHPIVRHAILAICAVAVFVGVSALALNFMTRHNRQKPVPNFIGVHIDEVARAAKRASLELEIADSVFAPIYAGGTVIEQTPAAGVEVKRGRRVFVTITSHSQKMVPVPYVTGFSLRQARNMIETAGLEIRRLRYVPNIATNNVLAEIAGRDTIRRGSNKRLEVGSGVTLVVGRSSSADWVEVPSLAGMTLGQAKSALWERGLNVGEITRGDNINLVNQRDARVARQSYNPGHQVELGTEIGFSIALND